jgi:hypothetical protein
MSQIFTLTARKISAYLRAKKDERNTPALSEEGRAEPIPPENEQPRGMNEAARMMELALKTQRLRWVAVGCDPAKNHGRLIASAILTDTMDAATDPAPTKPGVINSGKATSTFGFMSNYKAIAAAVTTEITRGKADWRVLGVKVTLYDELRERRIAHSSGVDWAWAS